MSRFGRALEAYRSSARGRSHRRPTAATPAAMRLHVAAGIRTAAEKGSRSRYLRPHQVRILADTAAHFDGSDDRWQSICVAPTASGKTEVFQTIVDGTCHRAPDGALVIPNTFVLVPTTHLVQQTAIRFQRRFPHLPVGWAAARIGVRLAPIMVLTYAGFVAKVLCGQIAPEDVDHIVLDEAHRALSDLRQDIFGRFIGNTVITAYTASPAYDLTKNLYALLGRHNTVAEIPIRAMIDARVIAPLVNYVVAIRLTGDLPRSRRERASLLAQAAADAAWSLYDEHEDEVTGARLRDLPFFGYTRYIRDAVLASEVFRSRAGADRFKALSGLDTAQDQRNALDALGSGRLDGIFNSRLLVEGTDVPNAALSLNLEPTDSLVMELQRCGRVMRRDPALSLNDPRQTAVVVDFYFELNRRPLGRPRFLFEAVDDPGLVRMVTFDEQSVEDLARRTEARARRGAGQQATTSAEEEADDREDDGFAIVDTDTLPGAVAQDEAVRPTRPQWTEGPEAAPRIPFTCVTDIEAVRYLLRRRDAVLDAEQWLPRWAAREALAVTEENTRFRALWDALSAGAADGGRPVIDGREVQFEARRVLNSRSEGGELGEGLAYCLHVDEVAWATSHLDLWTGATVEPGREWLSRWGFCKKHNVHAYNERLLAVWKALEASYRDNGDHAVYDGRTFRAGFTNDRNSGGRRAFVVHVDDEQAVLSLIGHKGVLPKKTPEWLNMSETAKRLGYVANTDGLRRIWHELCAALENGTPPLVAGEPVRFEHRATRGAFSYPNIHETGLPALAKALGTDNLKHPRLTDEWLPRLRCAETLYTTPDNPDLAALLDAILEQGPSAGTITRNGVTIRVAIRRVRALAIPCVHRDDAEALRRMFGVSIHSDDGSPWLGRDKVAELLEQTPSYVPFMRAWKELMASARRVRADGGPIPLRDVTVRAKILLVTGDRNYRTAFLHRDDVGAFAGAFGLAGSPLRTGDWLSRSQFLGLYGDGLNKDASIQIWSSLGKALAATGRAVHAGRSWRMEERVVKYWRLPCLHVSEADAFAETLPRKGTPRERPVRIPRPVPAVSLPASLRTRRLEEALRQACSGRRVATGTLDDVVDEVIARTRETLLPRLSSDGPWSVEIDLAPRIDAAGEAGPSGAAGPCRLTVHAARDRRALRWTLGEGAADVLARACGGLPAPVEGDMGQWHTRAAWEQRFGGGKGLDVGGVMEGLENRFRTRWLANGDSGPMILGDAALSCGYLPSGKFVVSARDDPAMRDLLGIGRPRGDSDLSFRQAYMRLGCANNHPGLLRCWDEMLAACERGGVPTLLGRPVRFEKTRSHGKGGGYCLHEGDLPLLAEAAGIHTVLKDDDNWLKYTDALHAVGFGQTNQDLKAVWEDLVRQVEEGKAPFLEGRAVRFDKRRSYGRIAFYLHRGDALTVRKAILRHQAGRLGKPFDENSPEIGNVKPRPSFTRPSLKARRVKPAWVTSGA